ncbi:hypothetical protein GGTG_01740 [Gaeumannomyces tritici R3-111a-1]|uniref:Uncharacterized protein n=1 Tax=Gaeumannomyces tritici (strain R3-111a-1) TaxID=644352 RepID=J3NKF1_GAET3|nr:hypothetical protein GGTG_01740 [Gaeumannomyces tritici R3-111a-1]EJT81765.1 hypothetical protein GGTG_01740 [Gaeumannomyces tritici R3-111a-1]
MATASPVDRSHRIQIRIVPSTHGESPRERHKIITKKEIAGESGGVHEPCKPSSLHGAIAVPSPALPITQQKAMRSDKIGWALTTWRFDHQARGMGIHKWVCMGQGGANPMKARSGSRGCVGDRYSEGEQWKKYKEIKWKIIMAFAGSLAGRHEPLTPARLVAASLFLLVGPAGEASIPRAAADDEPERAAVTWPDRTEHVVLPYQRTTASSSHILFPSAWKTQLVGNSGNQGRRKKTLSVIGPSSRRHGTECCLSVCPPRVPHLPSFELSLGTMSKYQVGANDRRAIYGIKPPSPSPVHPHTHRTHRIGLHEICAVNNHHHHHHHHHRGPPTFFRGRPTAPSRSRTTEQKLVGFGHIRRWASIARIQTDAVDKVRPGGGAV